MSQASGKRHRVKVSVTVDSQLLTVVDAYVREHPGADRGKVVDQALSLWYADQQASAMEEQFRAPRPETEVEQRAAWREVQRAAAVRVFRDPVRP